MLHRLIWNALIVLALTFIPNLGNATSAKTRGKDANNSKIKCLAEASRVPNAKTPPLMKVTPLQGGKFMLEPLTAPPKTISPSSSEPQKNEPKHISELSEALARRPVLYTRGGSLETGVATDCSGFVQFVYRHGFQVTLPRSSVEQAQVGEVVTRRMDIAKLLPGDLLFFREGERSIGHAGIYLGHGKMLHDSSQRGKVVITDLGRGYYFDYFVVAKRVLKEPEPKLPSLPRPRLVDSNRDLPGAPPLLLPISRLMPVIASKLLKIFWPWQYQGWEWRV